MTSQNGEAVLATPTNMSNEGEGIRVGPPRGSPIINQYPRGPPPQNYGPRPPPPQAVRPPLRRVDSRPGFPPNRPPGPTYTTGPQGTPQLSSLPPGGPQYSSSAGYPQQYQPRPTGAPGSPGQLPQQRQPPPRPIGPTGVRPQFRPQGPPSPQGPPNQQGQPIRRPGPASLPQYGPIPPQSYNPNQGYPPPRSPVPYQQQYPVRTQGSLERNPSQTSVGKPGYLDDSRKNSIERPESRMSDYKSDENILKLSDTMDSNKTVDDDEDVVMPNKIFKPTDQVINHEPVKSQSPQPLYKSESPLPIPSKQSDILESSNISPSPIIDGKDNIDMHKSPSPKPPDTRSSSQESTPKKHSPSPIFPTNDIKSYSPDINKSKTPPPASRDLIDISPGTSPLPPKSPLPVERERVSSPLNNASSGKPSRNPSISATPEPDRRSNASSLRGTPEPDHKSPTPDPERKSNQSLRATPESEKKSNASSPRATPEPDRKSNSQSLRGTPEPEKRSNSPSVASPEPDRKVSSKSPSPKPQLLPTDDKKGPDMRPPTPVTFTNEVSRGLVIKSRNSLNSPDGSHGKSNAHSPGTASRPASKTSSARTPEGDNDSGVDESTQGHEQNGSPGSPLKSPTKIPGLSRPPSATPSNKTSNLRSPSKPRGPPKTPDAAPPVEKKKVPMNKIQVGSAPSPNLKTVKSKIGSLDNAGHKPGGGHVKIENRKVDFKAGPKIAAKNEAYTPGGGDKKITHSKLQWSARSKIGSLENAHHKPGGGDKKIESQKLDFKEKAKPKVASKDNIKHAPGGGDIKIETQKVEFKAQSKIGSLENVKHKPGGGKVEIFNDKAYLKQIDEKSPGTPTQNEGDDETSADQLADENLNKES